MSDDRQLTTYSMWRSFRDCRMACKYRYFDNLSPLERAHSLAFGSVIHDCLELWHGTRDLAAVLAAMLPRIDQNYPKRHVLDTRAKVSAPTRDARVHLESGHGMMQGYAQAYPAEDFQIVALEKGFQGPIINSDSRLASQPRARNFVPFCSPASSQRASPCGRHRAAQRPALSAGA